MRKTPDIIKGQAMNKIIIRADPQNPNRMEDADKNRMALSLAEFGDLGGIVINRRTGFLIGGHQRASVLGDSLEIEDLKKPEPDGTVGRGWITKDGRRYAVRVVDWDEAKAHAALLAANRFGRVGKDDNTLLKDLLEELDTGALNMDVTGFDKNAIENLMTQFHAQEEPDSISEDFDIERMCIIVTSKTNDEQRLLFEELTGRGITCRLSSM